MNIIGFTIPSEALWLLGIVGACIALVVPHWLSNWRDRNNRFIAASAEFRAAFADSLLRLTTSNTATSTIIFQNHTAQVAAIFAFRPYVAWYRRRSFERDGKEYSLQANIQKAKGPIEALAFDFTPEAQAQRAALLAAIEKLVSHASAT